MGNKRTNYKEMKEKVSKKTFVNKKDKGRNKQKKKGKKRCSMTKEKRNKKKREGIGERENT